jgi:FixJ family two-component response regulator
MDRRLPVVVVARALDMPCYLEAMQLGAVDYLEEPVTVSEMGRVLGNHPPIRSKAA